MDESWREDYEEWKAKWIVDASEFWSQEERDLIAFIDEYGEWELGVIQYGGAGRGKSYIV